MFQKQVDKEHYYFKKYSYPGRWGSYYWQLSSVFESEPGSILEVGVGDGVFGRYVKEVARTEYTSIDVATDLNPDIVGSVTELPMADATYDVTCCFQVLEHLPFDVFATAVQELLRVSRRRVVISVPDCRPYIRFSVKLPLFPDLAYLCKLPLSHRVRLGGGHQWEIGYPGFPLSRIIGVMQKHGKLVNDFVPFENPYHHFFILEK